MPGEGPGRRARRALQGAAICEADSRPQMHFVPVKSIEQQSMLCVHRLREGFKVDRTACITFVTLAFVRFPTDGHFASWMGLCPGTKITGG